MNELNNTNETDVSEVQSAKPALEEHGISITRVSVDENKLLDQGYEKIPDSALISLNELLQYIPGVVADKAARIASEEATEEMLQDAMRVICKDGMHLANSRENPSRYRGMLFSDDGSGLSGAAELETIDRIKLSTAPQRVLYIFDILSTVTGQYYLANINKHLSNIEKTVQSVLEFMKDDKRNRIKTDQEFLVNYFRRLKSIKANESEKQSVVSHVIHIKSEARTNIGLFSDQIRNHTFSGSTKKSDINELVSVIKEYIPQYWCCVDLYAKSSLLYALLVDISDPDDLDDLWNDLSSKKADYKETYDAVLQWLAVLLRSKDAKGRLAALPISTFGDLASILLPGGELLKLITDIPSDIQQNVSQKRKERINEKLAYCITDCSDLSLIESTMEDVEKLKLIHNNGFEILKTQNAAYIKYFKEDPLTLVDTDSQQAGIKAEADE